MRTFVALAVLASASALAAEEFTPAEIRGILAHGPWPAPASTDPSNPASGKREAIELGRTREGTASSRCRRCAA